MKRINFFLAAIIFVLGMTGFAEAEGSKIRFVNAVTLKGWVDKSEKVILIDGGSLLGCLDAKIPGAVCLPCDDEKYDSFFSPLPKGSKLIFYSSYQALDAACPLLAGAQSAGFKEVYLLDGGLGAWRKSGFAIVSEKRIPRLATPAVKPAKLAQWGKKVTKPLLIDIRSAKAFAAGHLDGAVNYPLTRLHLQYADIPLDRTLLVVDDDGRAGFLAASYLARKGFLNVQRLQGGMAAVKRGAK